MDSSHTEELLFELYRHMKAEFPELSYEGRGRRARLTLAMTPSDKILIDMSSKVSDGLRVGFVLDIDVTHSPRRKAYEKRLLSVQDVVENVLNCPLVQNELLENTAKTGQARWCKIGSHHRMGVHLMVRYPEQNWRDLQGVSSKLAGPIAEEIKRLRSLSEQ